jgi:hypothetical protein
MDSSSLKIRSAFIFSTDDFLVKTRDEAVINFCVHRAWVNFSAKRAFETAMAEITGGATTPKDWQQHSMQKEWPIAKPS